METLKSFIKNNFSISYSFVYGNNLSKIFNQAFNNYKKNKSFKCNENKILKIISLGIYCPNDIEKLCKYLSDTDLNEIKKIHININTDTNLLRQKIKEHLKKIKNYRNKIKDKNKFSVVFFLNMLFINLYNINALLKDNEINIEKIKVFDKDELRYISKKPFLLGLIKKIPLKTLKTIKNKIKKERSNDTF